MCLLKNITVSLDYLFPPKLEIAACFSCAWDRADGQLEDCANEALYYTTNSSLVYLFPVFKELAKKYNLEFSVRYNAVLSLRRYIYAACIKVGDYLVKTKGLEKYMETMKVVKYDGF